VTIASEILVPVSNPKIRYFFFDGRRSEIGWNKIIGSEPRM
jgi:hypothetical protein